MIAIAPPSPHSAQLLAELVQLDQNQGLYWAIQHSINAACTGRLPTLRALVSAFGLTADDLRCNDNAALRSAAANGHADVVRFLIMTVGLTRRDVIARNSEAFRLAFMNGYDHVIPVLQLARGN